MSFTLAQKVPPPKPPQEPVSVQTYRLEVEILQGGAPAQGISALLYRLGPTGRAVPIGLRNVTRFSGADGKMSWDGLAQTDLMLQLRDPRTGFSLSLPLGAAYIAGPLSIGPYNIELRMSP